MTQPGIHLIGWTHFEPPPGVPWSTDTVGGPALAEFAGRACYQSWTKPNPKTATNAGYLRHILEVGHLSVLEHGTATFYFTGVSRSFTHELIRHRHFSYSQLSQRYVTDGGATIEPDAIAADPYLHQVYTDAVTAAQKAYDELVHGLERIIPATANCRLCNGTAKLVNDPGGWYCNGCNRYLSGAELPNPTAARKKARQAARAVLPNATETRIVVTGNYRAWRHFIDLRATEHAEDEIRHIAIGVLRALQQHAPNVFDDYTIVRRVDGIEVAHSPLSERS